MMQQTPLYEVHKRLGARLVPFAGYEMPVQYRAGVIAECRAVRENIGLFDVSHMGRFRVHGPDAASFLQHLTVNDVDRLDPDGGQAQYSLMCRDAGGIMDDIIVYRLGAREFIVVVNASNRDKIWKWMQHHAAARDFLLEDETEQTALIAVQGPKAADLLDALSDRELAVLPRFGLDESVIAGVQTMAARTGYTGEDGFELFCRAEEARHLWQELTDKGAVACGLGARDALRLEAALPLYGHEMDEHTHPYEARLGWVVRLDKAVDFIGRNALTQLKAAPRRKILVGLALEDRAIPRENYAVLAPGGGGDVVGHVTSGTFSPMLGKGIALARVDKAAGNIGAKVDVVVRDTRHTAVVVPLPFYKTTV